MTAFVAIDCGWLCCLENLDYEELSTCIAILNKVALGDIRLLIDHEGKIIAEYERNLTEQMLGRKFLTQVLKHGFVHYVTGRPSAGCLKSLEELGFDPSDVPYVGVAQSAGGGIYLTHESKHLAAVRIRAVEQHCGAIIAGTATVDFVEVN